MKCQKCGCDNRDEAKFCVGCGRLLERPSVLKTSTRWWYVAAAVLSVTVVVLLVVLIQKKGSDHGTEELSEPSVLYEEGSTKNASSGDGEAIKRSVESLGVERCEDDYLWQMRDGENGTEFKCTTKAGIDEGTAIGTRTADFDGDGADELLVVRWKDSSIALEMYEVQDGRVVLSNGVTDYKSAFPIKGVGALDVVCDAKGGIGVQWWCRNDLDGNALWWRLDRYEYDGKKFANSGKAELEGARINDLSNVKSQLSAMGCPTDSMPDVDKNEQFASSLLADTQKSLEVVTRIMATIDDGSRWAKERGTTKGGSEWSEAKKLGKFIVTQKAEEWPSSKPASSDSGDKSSSEPELQVPTMTESSPKGPYTLMGTVRVHEEDVAGQMVSVVSVVLDEPVRFEDEYKGSVFEVDAKEIMLATSNSDDYGEWARYDGCRVTVECDGLKEARHDASYYKVDAVVTDNVRLIKAEDSSEPDSASVAENLVRLDGCELAIPDAWVGKVVQGERYGDVTLEWNGFYMLFMRQCAPSEFPVFGPEEESYQLDNGASVSILRGDDYAVVAEVTYGSGKGLLLYFHAYSGESMNFFHRSEEECQEYLALQAAATGRSADEDPEQVAMACLKACVANLRFEE